MADSTGITILLAEQDADVRQEMATMLAGTGHSLVVASNGDEALDELCHLEPPVIIIINDHLPEVDGYQLLRLLKLRQGAQADYHPILMTESLLTALTSAFTPTHHTLEVHVLVKPFHPNELLLAVQLASSGGFVPAQEEAS